MLCSTLSKMFYHLSMWIELMKIPLDNVMWLNEIFASFFNKTKSITLFSYAYYAMCYNLKILKSSIPNSCLIIELFFTFWVCDKKLLVLYFYWVVEIVLWMLYLHKIILEKGSTNLGREIILLTYLLNHFEMNSSWKKIEDWKASISWT